MQQRMIFSLCTLLLVFALALSARANYFLPLNNGNQTTISKDQTGDLVSINIAPGKKITVSSEYADTYKALNAVDQNKESLWGSAAGDPNPYFIVDLGKIQEIHQLTISWYLNYYPKKFLLGVSLDGKYWFKSDILMKQDWPNITHLELSNNSIEDVTFFKNLNSLTNLRLEHNFITDITPLRNLSALTELSLNSNNIKDISVLQYLPSIDRLINKANPLVLSISLLRRQRQ